MSALYALTGTALLVVAVVDLLWTALWADGSAGPVARGVMRGTWGGVRRLGHGRSRTLSLAGPVILAATLFVWVGLMWLGWTLLFAAEPESLIDTRADEPVHWTGRLYFVAYTMFTMGNGDFTPRDGFWQVVTSFTAASGMLFVTLGASYVISVLGAVAQKQAFASSVLGLGRRAEAVVKGAWDGESLHALDLPLSNLGSQLGLLVHQHKSYPVLHYYHSARAADASALAVAVFDEALTLLRFGVPEAVRPNRVLLEGARSSVQSYLRTLGSAFIRPAGDAPPPPDLDQLAETGVPTLGDAAFADALADLADRRRQLLGMVRADAWDWPPTEPPSESQS